MTLFITNTGYRNRVTPERYTRAFTNMPNVSYAIPTLPHDTGALPHGIASRDRAVTVVMPADTPASTTWLKKHFITTIDEYSAATQQQHSIEMSRNKQPIIRSHRSYNNNPQLSLSHAMNSFQSRMDLNLFCKLDSFYLVTYMFEDIIFFYSSHSTKIIGAIFSISRVRVVSGIW